MFTPTPIISRSNNRLARSITVRDLKSGVETRVEVEAIDLETDLADRIFTRGHLERRRCGS